MATQKQHSHSKRTKKNSKGKIVLKRNNIKFNNVVMIFSLWLMSYIFKCSRNWLKMLF